MLLHNMVAANPREVIPLGKLPFHVVFELVASAAIPQAALIPITLSADDVADGALVNFLDGFDVAFLMLTLGTRNDGELFLVINNELIIDLSEWRELVDGITEAAGREPTPITDLEDDLED